MDHLLGALRRRAAEYDLEVLDTLALEQGEDTTLAVVRRRKESQQYLALLSPNMQMPDSYAHSRWTGPPLLVMGARVTPRNADGFRALGINYLDANGNAYFKFGNVLVDVRGRTGDPLATQYKDKAATSNLFSPKRAQVIFALISWPDILNTKLREIAHTAGVSVGFAQRTLVDMETANYIDAVAAQRDGRRLNNVDALIDGWVASFPAALGSPTKTRSFQGSFDPNALTGEGAEVYISGEGAAGWIRHSETWTLYCNDIPREAAAAGRWTARSIEPNIFIRPVFWNEPVHQANDVNKRVRVAPPLLVYADLIASGESRQREAAEQYRSEHVELRAG